MLGSPGRLKNDEQYPLLMVAGAGDAAVRPPPPVPPSVWNVSDSIQHRRPRTGRFPEFLSTCWVTFILLGISFLVFYAIGMLVINRHDTFILIKCNETRPASDVFYHNVIAHGAAFPLDKFSDYLAFIAMKYPSLRFNVIFLIDDSSSFAINKRTSLYNKMYRYSAFYEELNLRSRRSVKDFQKKYSNVNITVMTLSKFMAMTPLKHKWGLIPLAHLPFYARIYSVWAHGGIALDLDIQNNIYTNGQQSTDWKVASIMKQHNDGIKAVKYEEVLNKIERGEETKFFSACFDMMNKMLNETLSAFSTTSPFMHIPANNIAHDQPLIRTHRNKRTVINSDTKNETLYTNNTNMESIVNIISVNSSAKNVTGETDLYQMLISKGFNETTVKSNTSQIAEGLKHLDTYGFYNFDMDKPPVASEEKEKGNDTTNIHNDTDVPHVVLIYEFSVESEPSRSEFNHQHLVLPDRRIQTKSLTSRNSGFVTIDAEGSLIVAATSKFHNFLYAILVSGCRRMSPEIAIENALATLCTGIHRDESFCNSIHVL